MSGVGQTRNEYKRKKKKEKKKKRGENHCTPTM
jgi:hypothetical protein